MPRQGWVEVIALSTADGTAIANTTTETIIFPNVTIPANYMADGRLIRITAYGRHSTTGTPTLTFRIRLGGVAGTVIVASGALTTGSGVTAGMWRMEVLLQMRSNGSAGTVLGTGLVLVGDDAASTVGSATNTHGGDFMGSAGVATPATASLDFTADQALSITATWSAASASNTLTGHNYVVESLN